MRLERHAPAGIEVDWPAHENATIGAEELAREAGAAKVRQPARPARPDPQIQRRDHDVPGALRDGVSGRSPRRPCAHARRTVGHRGHVVLEIEGVLSAGRKQQPGKGGHGWRVGRSKRIEESDLAGQGRVDRKLHVEPRRNDPTRALRRQGNGLLKLASRSTISRCRSNWVTMGESSSCHGCTGITTLAPRGQARSAQFRKHAR